MFKSSKENKSPISGGENNLHLLICLWEERMSTLVKKRHKLWPCLWSTQTFQMKLSSKRHPAGTCALLFTIQSRGPASQHLCCCFCVHKLALLWMMFVNDDPVSSQFKAHSCNEKLSAAAVIGEMWGVGGGWILRQLLLHPRLTGSPLWWGYKPPEFNLSQEKDWT